jgi:hypothetical protein
MATVYNFRFLSGIGALLDSAAVAEQQKLDAERQKRAKVKEVVEEKIEQVTEALEISSTKRKAAENVVANAEAQRENGPIPMQTSITTFKTEKQAELTAQSAEKTAQQADYDTKARAAYLSAAPLDASVTRVVEALMAYGQAQSIGLSSGVFGMLLNAVYYLQQTTADLTAELRVQATDQDKPSAAKFTRLTGLVSRRNRAQNAFDTVFADFRENLINPFLSDITEMDQSTSLMASAAQALNAATQAMVNAGLLLISKTTLVNATLAQIEAAEEAEEKLLRYGGFTKVFDTIGLQVEKNRRLQQIANSQKLTTELNILTREQSVVDAMRPQIDKLGETVTKLGPAVTAMDLELNFMATWINTVSSVYTQQFAPTNLAGFRLSGAFGEARNAYNLTAAQNAGAIEEAAINLATTTQRLVERIDSFVPLATALVADLQGGISQVYQSQSVARFQSALNTLSLEHKPELLTERETYSKSATATTSPLAIIAGLNAQSQQQAANEQASQATAHVAETTIRVDDLHAAAVGFQTQRPAGAARPSWQALFDNVENAQQSAQALGQALAALVAATTNIPAATSAVTQAARHLQGRIEIIKGAQTDFEATLDADLSTPEYAAVKTAIEALDLANTRHRTRLASYALLRSVIASSAV